MFKDAFKELNGKKIQKIIDILNPMLEASDFEVGKTKALTHPLPFYPTYQFVEIRQTNTNPLYKVNLILPMDDKKWDSKKTLILDGTNKPFYMLNKGLPISLNDENVLTYVQFFFEYVRGAQGKFQILSTLDDINWHEEPAPSGKKALAKMVSPLSIIEKNEEFYLLKASIVFKDSLFESDITVRNDGLITLSNQKILVEDLPIIDPMIA